MMLWQVARDLTRRLPEWETPAKISLAIALPLLIILLGIGFFGPESLQLPARLGAFGLLITIQLLFLWSNRRDASPYHQAQQHFIAGEYQAARELLEAIPERGRASALMRWSCLAIPIVIWAISTWLKRVWTGR